jgi:hypothetical protein
MSVIMEYSEINQQLAETVRVMLLAAVCVYRSGHTETHRTERNARIVSQYLC